jgi:glycosyltransferase involved in cell wall biosynthesis
MKFALVSNSLPPSLGGQATMIHRLLKGLNPSTYCLLSRKNYDGNGRENSYMPKLPAKYYHLRKVCEITRGYRFGLARVRESLNVPIGIVSRGLQIARIVRQERCAAIIACTGDLLNLPAAYMASRLTGVKFYPYVFDDYAYQWTEPMDRFVARRLEPLLMRGAAGIITPNEFMSDELRRRYGVDSAVIRNSSDPAEYEGLLDGASDGRRSEIKIVFTGAIYEAHLDAVRNLLAALDLLRSPAVKLHLYTGASPSSLAPKGIDGPVVFHNARSLSEMPGTQRRADILFLPLSFNSPYPEVIKTSAPGKLGEYLASRRPILVHAPADSFVAWYFRRYDCGVVVDREDPEALRRAIEEILNNVELQQKLCANAWSRALADFSCQVVQIRFAELLNLEPNLWTSS